MYSYNIDQSLNTIKKNVINAPTISAAVRHLNILITIPHLKINHHIEETVQFLLSNDRFTLDDRYSILSSCKGINNDTLYKLHTFYFHNFNPPTYPAQYKLNSANFLLGFSHKDNREVKAYLYYLIRGNSMYKDQATNIFKNNNIPIENINPDAIDERMVLQEYIQERKQNQPLLNNRNINNENRRRIVISRRTTYEDGQNVHITSINESVKELVYSLHKEFPRCLDDNYRIINVAEVSKNIARLTKEKLPHIKQKINGSLDRIMSDTSTYKVKDGNYNLCDVLILVYTKIKTSPHKEELDKRLCEELLDMNGMCATGHLSRLVNILSGFFEMNTITISYKEQIKNYVFSHYNKRMEVADNKDVLLDEIIEEDKSSEDEESKKENLYEFIKRNSNEGELRKEFVFNGYVKEEEFQNYYKDAIKSYCGLT